jgi:Flp pilus assembly protein TadB
MRWERNCVQIILVLTAFIFMLVLPACEGSDARKSVTGTVQDMVGQKTIERGEKMRKDIDQAMKEEARRLLKMDEQAAGNAPQEQATKDAEDVTDD